MSTQENNRPAHTIRYGRIKAAIWANPTQNGVMYNVTFTRSYQDDQGNWNDTQSFGVSDLMTVSKIASDAHTWISSEQAKDEDAAHNGANRRTDGRGGSPSRRPSPRSTAQVPN